MPNSYWKNLRHIFSGGKKYSTNIASAATRSAFPLRQCPACALYSRNDPAKCPQCTDVDFLLRSPFVVHDLNEDFAANRVQAVDLLNRIVAECQQKNEAFVDETFPQNAASTVPTQDVDWCRLFKDQQKIFGDVVRSSEIIIRDALFLVSHASCRPYILQNIFMTTEAAVCPEGAYVLRLCSNGRWTTVILDDSVPFEQDNIHPRTETSDGDLWVSLIEKAAAKLCGSYENLAVDGGDVCEWMEMLTGAPTESTRLADYLNSAKNRDGLWEKLLDAYKNGFLMMATSGDNPADETTKSLEKDTDGDPFVRSKQNYEIVKVLEDATVRKLSLRQSLDKDQLPMFDITLGDFIQYFCVMHVCRVRPDWTEVRVEGTLPSQCPLNDEEVDIPIRRLTIAEKTSLDITFYQNVQNEKPADGTGRLLTDLSIVIFTERSGHDIENRVNFEDIVCQSPRCTQASVSLHCQLNPGSYLIACLSINSFLYDYGDDVKFVMAVRSPQPLLPMRKLQFTRGALTDALIRLTMFKGAPALPSILSPGVNAFAYANPIWHGRILVVENTVRDKFAVVNFFCPLRDVVATRSSMPTRDYIPPVCRRIVAILTEKEWDRLGLFSTNAGFVVASTVANKDPSDDESTPKFGDRVKGLHVARPMWLT